MPIYAYRCQACSQSFDRMFKSIHNIPKQLTCPHCASRRVKRLITAPNVRAGDGAVGGDDGSAEAPAETGLFGRKELNEVVKKRKKAGLAG